MALNFLFHFGKPVHRITMEALARDLIRNKKFHFRKSQLYRLGAKAEFNSERNLYLIKDLHSQHHDFNVEEVAKFLDEWIAFSMNNNTTMPNTRFRTDEQESLIIAMLEKIILWEPKDEGVKAKRSQLLGSAFNINKVRAISVSSNSAEIRRGLERTPELDLPGFRRRLNIEQDLQTLILDNDDFVRKNAEDQVAKYLIEHFQARVLSKVDSPEGMCYGINNFEDIERPSYQLVRQYLHNLFNKKDLFNQDREDFKLRKEDFGKRIIFESLNFALMSLIQKSGSLHDRKEICELAKLIGFEYSDALDYESDLEWTSGSFKTYLQLKTDGCITDGFIIEGFNPYITHDGTCGEESIFDWTGANEDLCLDEEPEEEIDPTYAAAYDDMVYEDPDDLDNDDDPDDPFGVKAAFGEPI